MAFAKGLVTTHTYECYQGLLDFSPGDIDRGVDVRIQAETALLTTKGGLGLSIGLFAMSTLATGTTRVSRINKPDRDTRPGCLVGDVHPQLEEGPAMPFVAILTPNRCPLSNPREVFERECLARYDGFVDQGSTDLLVDIFLKTLLASRKLLEATLCRTGPHPLQRLATLLNSAHELDGLWPQ